MSERSAEGSRQRGLAKGLAALLADPEPETRSAPGNGGMRTVPIDCLRPSRVQPRRRFDEAETEGLAKSVREKGVLQPILVRPDSRRPGSYEIIAGERRWRAAERAQLHDVPVVVREVTDREALEVALVENVQRQDLTPVEEADGYRRLIGEFAHTQEALASVVGKSRSHVANTLRLLNLPEPVKAMLDDGRLSAGHARALLAAADPVTLAGLVVARGLNVRQTEKLVKKPGRRRAPAETVADANTRALERSLGDHLGLKVTIRHRHRGGRLTIHYRTLEQLDDLLRRLGDGG